jgi:hypothetical protein
MQVQSTLNLFSITSKFRTGAVFVTIIYAGLLGIFTIYLLDFTIPAPKIYQLSKTKYNFYAVVVLLFGRL